MCDITTNLQNKIITICSSTGDNDLNGITCLWTKLCSGVNVACRRVESRAIMVTRVACVVTPSRLPNECATSLELADEQCTPSSTAVTLLHSFTQCPICPSILFLTDDMSVCITTRCQHKWLSHQDKFLLAYVDHHPIKTVVVVILRVA